MAGVAAWSESVSGDMSLRSFSETASRSGRALGFDMFSDKKSVIVLWLPREATRIRAMRSAESASAIPESDANLTLSGCEKNVAV